MLDDRPTIRCIRCGYDLRGQDTNGRCPECGLRAHWSLVVPSALSQFPPLWVSTMAWATRILACCYLSAAVLVSLSPYYGTFKILQIAEHATLITAAVNCVGTWLLSMRSGHWSEPPAPLTRWIMRIGSLGPFIVLAAALKPGYLTFNVSLELIVLLVFFLTALVPVAVFFRLRNVARMIANPALAEHSGIVAIGSLLVFFAVPLGWYVVGYFGIIRNRANSVLIGIFVVGGTLFLLWAACVFAWCVIDFGRAARIARKQWNADAPTV